MSATVPKIGWPRKNFFLLLVLPTHLPKLKARLYWRVWGHNLQNRKGISVVLHWQNLLEISLEIARNLPSGVLRKVIQAEGVLPAVNSMKLPRKSWKPIGCCVLLTTVHCKIWALGKLTVLGICWESTLKPGKKILFSCTFSAMLTIDKA